LSGKGSAFIGSGFRVQGSGLIGLEVLGSEFGVQGSAPPLA